MVEFGEQGIATNATVKSIFLPRREAHLEADSK